MDVAIFIVGVAGVIAAGRWIAWCWRRRQVRRIADADRLYIAREMARERRGPWSLKK